MPKLIKFFLLLFFQLFFGRFYRDSSGLQTRKSEKKEQKRVFKNAVKIPKQILNQKRVKKHISNAF